MDRPLAPSATREWPVPAQLASQIAALGSHLGLESLQLGFDGELALAIDDGVTVHVSCPPHLSELLLRVRVGTLSRHVKAAVLIDLLRFNRLDTEPDGPLVGLSEDDPPQLILAQRVYWRRLQVPEFVATVEHFIATAEDLDAMQRAVGEPFGGRAEEFVLKG